MNGFSPVWFQMWISIFFSLFIIDGQNGQPKVPESILIGTACNKYVGYFKCFVWQKLMKNWFFCLKDNKFKLAVSNQCFGKQ